MVWEGSLFLSENELGKGHSDILSEFLVVLVLVLGDRVINLVVDLGSVDDEVLSNMVDEAGWALEDGGHLLKLLKVSNNTLAVGDSWLDVHDSISEVLESISDISRRSTRLGEIFIGNNSIVDNDGIILDAVLDVVKTLSVDGTSEDTDDDLFGSLERALSHGHLSISEESFGEDVSHENTRGLVLAILDGSDGRADLLEDIDSVDNQVVSDVGNEDLWVLEGDDHFLELEELLEVLWLGAGLNSRGHGLEDISEVLHALDDTSDSLGFNLGNGILDIGSDFLTIVDGAGDVVIKMLGLESSLIDTLSNEQGFVLGDLDGLGVGQKECNGKRSFHLNQKFIIK